MELKKTPPPLDQVNSKVTVLLPVDHHQELLEEMLQLLVEMPLNQEEDFNKLEDQVLQVLTAQLPEVTAQLLDQVMAQPLDQVMVLPLDQVTAQLLEQVMAQPLEQVMAQVTSKVTALLLDQVTAQPLDQVTAQLLEDMESQTHGRESSMNSQPTSVKPLHSAQLKLVNGSWVN
jgi:hypothetical protein